MAEWHKPEEDIKCSICLDTYANPKLLQCFHVYCQDCLLNLVAKDGQQGIACPACRQTTPLPPTGVEGLQAAFHINRLLQKEGGKASEESSTKFCPDHSREETKMYCETCGVLVCSQCVSIGGKHHRHDYDSMAKAFQKYKEEIGSSIVPMEKKLATVKKALEDLDASCSNTTEQEAAVEATISDAMEQIRMVLNAREAELLEQVEQVSDAKMRAISTQRDSLVNTQSQLVGALKYMRESNEIGGTRGNRPQLMMRTTTSLHPDDLKPSVEADIRFEASPDITAACENFGDVSMKLAEKGPRSGLDGRKAKAIRDHKACMLFRA